MVKNERSESKVIKMSLSDISTEFLIFEEYQTSDSYFKLSKATDDEVYRVTKYNFSSPLKNIKSLTSIRFLSREKFQEWYSDSNNPDRKAIPTTVYEQL